MNIAVLIRTVVDCRVPLPADSYGQQPLPEGLIRITNPADWGALQQSLELALNREEDEIMVVSLGDQEAEEALRRCLAAGARQALRVWDEALTEADILGRAKALTAALTPARPDLILTGDGSLDQFDTLLPGALAAAAGITYVPGAVKVERVEAGTAVVIRRREKGKRERVEVSLPALIALEDGGNYPEDASLPVLIAALGQHIPCRDLASLGLSPDRVGSRGAQVYNVDIGRAKPVTVRPRTPDPEMSAEQRLRTILAGGMPRKQGEVITGAPEQMADRIAQFLRGEPVTGL